MEDIYCFFFFMLITINEFPKFLFPSLVYSLSQKLTIGIVLFCLRVSPIKTHVFLENNSHFFVSKEYKMQYSLSIQFFNFLISIYN